MSGELRYCHECPYFARAQFGDHGTCTFNFDLFSQEVAVHSLSACYLDLPPVEIRESKEGGLVQQAESSAHLQ